MRYKHFGALLICSSVFVPFALGDAIHVQATWLEERCGLPWRLLSRAIRRRARTR